MGKISDETRALVKFLSMEKKYSIRQIAKKAKISKSTVARYLNPSKKASKKDKQLTNTGRPKILSARDIRLLKRSITQLRGASANFTVEELIRYSGLQTTSASYSIWPWQRIFPCSCLRTLSKYCLVHITASTLPENLENCRKCNDSHLNLKISA